MVVPEMTILDRIPELVCPECKCELELAATLRCTGCGNSYEIHGEIPHMVSGDMLEFAREIAVQDSVAIEYEEKRYQVPHARDYHDWWTDRMLTVVKADGRILDNGCGVGLLHDTIPTDQIVGLDLSSEMLERASQRSNRLVLGNSQQLPFRDGSFDLVFCRSILHHLPAPGEAVREMSRVLRPGGEVVLVETNKSLLSTFPRRIANRGGHFSEDHQNMDRRILKNMLEPYFTIDEVSYFGYVAYPLLGFPDLVDIFRYVPFKSVAARILMGIDSALSKIPLVRTQSWAILFKATADKKERNKS
jgi:ubiquinone/menaquinone biosynthesis C-methylase UbiE